MQRLRDNPECAQQEYRPHPRCRRSGLARETDVRSGAGHRRAFHRGGARPRIAILREQGVNGQIEMAAAFDRAGFEAVDVHMSDIIAGRISLVGTSRASSPAADFPTATCWARARAGPSRYCSIARARDEFEAVLPARRRLRARRLQRLPDDEQSARTHSRHGALAAFRAQSVRAVRGARGDGGSRRRARRCSSTAWRAAACRSRSRTAKATRSSRSTAQLAAARKLVALRFVDNRGKPTERYPLQSQRFARRASPA